MIEGIHHVQLAMPEGAEDRAHGFYTGLLELSQVEKPAALAGRGGCWFGSDKVQVHLGVEADFRPAKKAHPAFLIGDLDKFTTKLTEAGYPFKRDVDLPGASRVFLEDPYGNRIEVIAPLKAGS